MDVTFTEREALRKFISYIQDERERLLGEYIKAIQKLSELDNMDNVHQQIKPDLEPKTLPEPDTEPEMEVEPESETEEYVPESKTESEPTITEEDESEVEEENSTMSLKEEIDKYKEEYNLDDLEEEKEQSPYESRDNVRQKELYKDQDNRKSRVVNVPTRKSSYRDVKMITKSVISIMKTKGRPVKTSEIIQELNYQGVETASPYSLLQQVRNYEPKIRKVKHGYYEYV